MTNRASKEVLPTPRWTDPFRTYRADMDCMFDAFFGDRGLVAPRMGFGAPMAANGNGFIVPDIDITENDKEVSLTAELPGLDDKDVDLSVRNGLLTLKGEKKYEHVDDKDDVHVVERRFGSFQRSFRLPETVDAERIDAKFDKGVLRVVMPKKVEAVEPVKKIAIRAK